MANWALACSSSFMMGGFIGGAIGQSNWMIVHLISSFVAVVAFVFLYYSKEPPRHDIKEIPEGIDRVFKSLEFRLLAAVQLIIGLQFTGNLVICTIVAAFKLGLTSMETGLLYGGVAGLHMIENFVLFPRVMKRYGNSIIALDGGCIVAFTAAIFLSFDIVYDTHVVLVALLLILNTAFIPLGMQSMNLIGPEYAERHSKNSRGVVLGVSRLFFNIGQMLGPAVAVALYSAGGYLAFFMTFGCIMIACYCPWRYTHVKRYTENDKKTLPLPVTQVTEVSKLNNSNINGDITSITNTVIPSNIVITKEDKVDDF